VSEGLILFAADSIDAPMAWALVDTDDGAILARGFTNESKPPATAPAQTAVVLPGADAQVKRIELPARTEAQARAAAPMLFEGAIAAQQDVHYSIGGAQNAAGARLVAAMAPARLAAWLERCHGFGADPHIVALDFTVWPAAPGDVEVHVEDARAIVAGGTMGGFSIEPALAPGLAARWLARLPEAPTRILFSGGNAGGDCGAWREALGSVGSILTERTLEDSMAHLARGVVDFPDYAPNLRQGDFAPEARRPAPWRLWRFAAALALLAVLLQVGSLTLAGWRDMRAAEQTMADSARDLSAARPDLGRITNVRAQVRGLVNAQEQSRRNPVLGVNEPLLRALERQPLVRLDEVRHQAPDRIVRLQVSAAQAPALEAFVAELQGLGVSVQTRVLRPQLGRYAAEVTVESP
jgi:type II secretion system protein L